MPSDGEALFQAVCENPADDTPRLVYADWLEEHFKPARAELIRLQCEAWDLCPDYPTDMSRRVRASELLKTHGDRWYAELPTGDRVLWSSLFVRGFVDTVQVYPWEEGAGLLVPLFAATPLSHLGVGFVEPEQLLEILALPQLGRLTTFRLGANRLGPEERKQLADAERRFPRTKFHYPRPG